jgi:hypothetical protein
MTVEQERLAMKLIQEGSTINDRDEYGNSPLICAIRSGHFGIAQSLLNRGAEVSFRNNQGCCALHYLWRGYELDEPSVFARSQKPELKRIEDDALKVFNEVLLRGSALLDSSVLFCDMYDRFRAIRFLPRALQLRSDLVRACGWVWFDTLGHSKRGTLLHWLISHAEWLRRQGPSAQTEIELCLSTMRVLISIGLPVDWCGDDAEDDHHGHFDRLREECSVTALAAAVQSRFHEGVVLLLEARADPNSKCFIYNRYNSCLQGSVLMHAAFDHSIPDIKSLIKSSANVKEVGRSGHTALTMLLQSLQVNSSASLEALKLLISASADCNVILPDGDSALALAMKCRSSRLLAIEHQQPCSQSSLGAFMDSEVLVLLRNGARVSQKEVNLATDLQLPNVTRHLLSCGGNLSSTLAHMNKRRDESFYCAFFYPYSILVSHCKVPHVNFGIRIPNLVPLFLLQPPLRVKSLCVGGLLLHLLGAFLNPIPFLKRLHLLKLSHVLSPVVHRCTGLAAVISFAGVKNASPAFCSVDQDFGLKCGFYGYSWLPEHCKDQLLPPPQCNIVQNCHGADEDENVDRSTKCTFM